MNSQTPRLLNIPNVLSGTRLLIAPLLVVVAVAQLHRVFVVLLAISLVTDILDGKIARWLGQTSELGAKLDSWADMATYMLVPFCAYFLRPEVLTSLALVFWTIVAAYVVPISVGFAKFGSLTIYHTRGAVISAYFLGASTLVFFSGGPTWPLWGAALVLALAEVEEVLITLTLLKPHSNVKDLRQARRLRERDAASNSLR
jgi:CDP-diacylglycerol--glycerol-3-phosphate 3-phosphatidyltransferase